MDFCPQRRTSVLQQSARAFLEKEISLGLVLGPCAPSPMRLRPRLDEDRRVWLAGPESSD